MKLFISLLLLPLSAFARLGETREQCAARYGAPVGSGPDVTFYFKDGFLISASFADGRVSCIKYSSLTKPYNPDGNNRARELTVDEKKKLLSYNSMGWEKDPGEKFDGDQLYEQWSTSKGYVARYLKTDEVLIISDSWEIFSIKVNPHKPSVDNL